MLENNFADKLNELKFKPECLDMEVVEAAEVFKLVEQLQTSLTSSIIDELNKAVNAYTQGVGELQKILKQTEE